MPGLTQPLVAATLASLLAVPGFAGDAKPATKKPTADKPATGAASAMDAMMEAMVKAGTPGPEHGKLAALAGTWTMTIQQWMAPGEPPMTSKGTAEKKMILGGRYLQEEVSGTSEGQPFQGLGFTGYDNLQKKYVGTWMDNMSTGMMSSSGTFDATGTVLNCTAESLDPMTGKRKKYRMVDRIVEPDRHVMEMYGTGPDGKEMKMMEITYERMN